MFLRSLSGVTARHYMYTTIVGWIIHTTKHLVLCSVYRCTPSSVSHAAAVAPSYQVPNAFNRRTWTFLAAAMNTLTTVHQYANKRARMCVFFSHFYFPASGQAVVSGVIPSPPRYVLSVFIAHWAQHSHCSSRSSNVANLRFRAFRESICAQEKVPTNLYEYALGGTRTLCTSCINYSVYTCGRQLLRAYTYWSTAWVDIGQNDQIVLYLCAFCSQPHFIIASAAYKWSRQWTRLGQ